MIKNITNLGDAALYCDFGDKVNKEINLNVINFFKNLQKLKIKGVTNISPSYNKLIISFDLSETNFNDLKEKISKIKFENLEFKETEIIKIPLCCDEEFKLDLKRLETPRVKVPKGAVGITEQFCNIYTFESPGGWNIIGNTPLSIFDKSKKNNPSLIKPGDTVNFFKISKKEYLNWNE